MNSYTRLGMSGLFLGLVSLGVWWVALAQPEPSKPTTKQSTTPRSVKEIENYQSWPKVNELIHAMSPAVAAMCAPPPIVSEPLKGSKGPHRGKWISVYVNPAGETAMMTKKQPHFPVGTVIVKQKLPSRTSTTPELLTIMIKHAKGYDPKKGDWEYMVTDGDGIKVQQRGKLGSCQGCHNAYAKTDYIVRSYLPTYVETALK